MLPTAKIEIGWQAISRNRSILAAQRAGCMAGASNTAGDANGTHGVAANTENFRNGDAGIEFILAHRAFLRLHRSSSVVVHRWRSRSLMLVAQCFSLTPTIGEKMFLLYTLFRRLRHRQSNRSKITNH